METERKTDHDHGVLHTYPGPKDRSGGYRALSPVPLSNNADQRPGAVQARCSSHDKIR